MRQPEEAAAQPHGHPVGIRQVGVVMLLAAGMAASPLPARAAGQVYPGEHWTTASPRDMGMDAGLLEDAERYALTGGGSGMIVRGGRLVHAWGDAARKYDLKSTSKGIGVTALGLALMDEVLALDDPAVECHPSLGTPPDANLETTWIDRITIRHLATQTAGFSKPGGYDALLFAPGTSWHYSDSGPNWLAECLTLLYGRDMEALLFDRVFTRLGITADDLHWRNNSYRPHTIRGVPRREFGSGVHATVDAMARISYLYLRGGRWDGEQLIPRAFVRGVGRPDPAARRLPAYDPERRTGEDRSPRHYGLLWWNNADGELPGVPQDAFWTWGLHESLIVVIPSLDLVVARAGRGWRRRPDESFFHYEVLAPFLEPIVRSVVSAPRSPGAPYPPSTAIVHVQWQDEAEIVRLARGSDNWPMTWADDDHLYSAYGDGWGFEPRVPEKLSLGLVRVEGGPPDVVGINLRSEDAERRGDGVRGEKASGLLMVDGVLYMLSRNAGNSILSWSEDHGRTWTRADWKFTTSFGAPTFLNFGRNYAGARDSFVYVYSHDDDSAYETADRMVLARAPVERIRERSAYEFFVGLDASGSPSWSPDESARGAVFEHEGNCHRSGITYNAALGRYLWWQAHRESAHPQGNRFEGGFGLYDAPEPWGPWTTVYFTKRWDVGAGESGSFPTKWMSEDGRTVHLVFSGDDFFSIRRATFATSAR